MRPSMTMFSGTLECHTPPRMVPTLIGAMQAGSAKRSLEYAAWRDFSNVSIALTSGINFSMALTPVFAATSLAPVPIAFAGIVGFFDLAPGGSEMSTLVTNSSIGLSRIFLPIPNNSQLVGTEVVFQSARLPMASTAHAVGFSNAVADSVGL